MGDEEVQSAMDVIEDKRDAARDAFEDLCMTVDRMIEEKADLCMTVDRMNEEKAEKQEEARARWSTNQHAAVGHVTAYSPLIGQDRASDGALQEPAGAKEQPPHQVHHSSGQVSCSFCR